MANDKVIVTVFYRGFFRTSPSLEYIGGRVIGIVMNLKAKKLCNIIDAINTLGGGKIDCLYYKIPMMQIKEGLRELWSDGDVVDMLYHHQDCDIIEMYVEYVNDDDEDDHDIAHEAVDDEERLVDVEHPSDDKDEDLVEGRQKVKEYSMRHRLKKGHGHEDEEFNYCQLEDGDDNIPDDDDDDDDEDNNDNDDEHYGLHLSNEHYGRTGTSHELILPTELPSDSQGMDSTGCQTDYHSSDEQGSLHFDVDQDVLAKSLSM